MVADAQVRVPVAQVRPGMTIDFGKPVVVAKVEQRPTWFHGDIGWVITGEDGGELYVSNSESLYVYAEAYEF